MEELGEERGFRLRDPTEFPTPTDERIMRGFGREDEPRDPDD